MHNAHGTTRSVLSLVTARVEPLATRLETIARVTARDPRVLGAHLEGPFLDTEFRGAHDPAPAAPAPTPTRVDGCSRRPTARCARSRSRPSTTARPRRSAGSPTPACRVAVGHTGADFETALAAFDAGASILTHAFNGMRGIHHRAPGPVVAAMTADHVTLEVINDGVHVHPEVVKLAFAGAPGRVALITDAMAADRLGRRLVPARLARGRRRGAASRGSREGGSIAGSTLTQDEALRRAVVDSGIPTRTTRSAALTASPAAAIGRERDLGRLEPGFAADAVLLGDALDVQAVWGAGVRAQLNRGNRTTAAGRGRARGVFPFASGPAPVRSDATPPMHPTTRRSPGIRLGVRVT